MSADLTPAGSAAVRLADALVRTKKQRDRARDLACAYEAQLAKVWALITEDGGALSCGGLTIDAPGCFAGDLATKIRRVLDVPDE